ncbi:MAG: hypothetical protein QF637_00430 [Acidimicrobiales bacterium]|nr:hypothetical protein [Acidimicrobiales bacterium]
MAGINLLAQQSQNAVGTGSQKWWFLVAILFLLSLCLMAAFIKVWRRTVPPARAPYVPPDLVFSVVDETEPNANKETREVEPGLGSGDGRWIQPPRND